MESPEPLRCVVVGRSPASRTPGQIRSHFASLDSVKIHRPDLTRRRGSVKASHRNLDLRRPNPAFLVDTGGHPVAGVPGPLLPARFPIDLQVEPVAVGTHL